MRALADNISKYESQNGLIQESKGPDHVLPLNFGGPKAEA
jgi:hypothetical protein